MTKQVDFLKAKPQDCLSLSFEESLKIVKHLIGEEKFNLAKQYKIPSPVNTKLNTNWFKESKIIGINPRLVGTYWGIVKYAISFPENAIHLMPLFETGDGSLYVQNSWRLNTDFFDENLNHIGFDSCEKQLKFVVNILHALDKTVGFDALPHVDNFSEIVILNPKLFEWIKLNKDKTAQDFSLTSDEISKEIEELLIKTLNLQSDFFSLDETLKTQIIFPENIDRFKKRMSIRKALRQAGYEPIPVVEHCPMRPILFKKIEYSDNENWAIFDVKGKSHLAKIVGAITPYKLYHVKQSGSYIEKDAKDIAVWDYFATKLYNFEQEYNFDFFRADMGHNQIAHSHAEEQNYFTEELWSYIKNKIQETKPYFATIGEAFFCDYYINGIQDMINKKFDIVLGNLNFQYLNADYTSQINKFIKEYHDYPFVPCNTLYTNDGDLPSHQQFFQSQEANILRYFMGLFLKLPSYMGMGYEVRNLFPAKQNNFSNYYVKNQPARFEFGNNEEMFEHVCMLREIYAKNKCILKNSNFIFHKTNSNNIFAWSYQTQNKNLLFIANLDNNVSQIIIENFIFESGEILYNNLSDTNMQLYKENNSTIIDNIFIGDCFICEYQ